MLERTRLKGRTQVTFVLPEERPAGPVGVVGDCNHWNPAAHPLQPRGDGTRAAQVSLPAHSSHSLRYLAAGAPKAASTPEPSPPASPAT
ncbi:hypothetical protein ACFVJM_37095 [Streptomyces virginiae]|uniref:hypothetical protein n=1 Tax=Streptomyces virginiae TaxID=1961 RepID=UPI003634B046